ncbi:MAG: hypothetical protein NZ455_15170 [Bacteroidia bacterium]|nr:hypothetical protein [Bacteroidia bacterium]
MPLGSTKRSEVPKRSVVRNAPTLAQQGARPRNKITFQYHICKELHLFLLKFLSEKMLLQ